MNCPFCGSSVSGGTVCHHCGKSLVLNSYNQNMFSNNVQNNNVATINSQNVYAQQPVDGVLEIDDNELLNIYIGKNAASLRDNSFSWCTFFFGAPYMFYRKMWITGRLNTTGRRSE